MQILVQFAGTYLREYPGNKVLWNWVFSFLFSFVEMFQFSYNFESSLKSFSAEFSAEFSFSFLYRISVIDFRLILLLFLGKLFAFTVWNIYRLFKKRVTKHFCWLKFTCLYSWSPNSYFRLILVLFLGKLLICLQYPSAIQEASLVPEFVLSVPTYE